jgi:hypothetical protein
MKHEPQLEIYGYLGLKKKSFTWSYKDAYMSRKLETLICNPNMTHP